MEIINIRNMMNDCHENNKSDGEMEISSLPSPLPLPNHPDVSINLSKNILLILSPSISNEYQQQMLNDLRQNFCGIVIEEGVPSSHQPDFTSKVVYICGDISIAVGLNLSNTHRVYIVKDLSTQDDSIPWCQVSYGQVPILVHGVGVYYRQFFDPQLDLFNRICAEHVFQSLSESDKPGIAHRTGIYITPVEQSGDDVHFNLLRCSSNFSGPTANFGSNDRRIVDALNEEAAYIFDNAATLNHVLAQIYHNSAQTNRKKQTKAKIKEHSDKTKDMPHNHIMGFCSFYKNLDHLTPMSNNIFDYGYKGKGHSALTTLYFRLKNTQHNLPPEFNVTLYPNSVFFIPSLTNRLYTHEIRPSQLDARLLPTRMGYVVRCSNTQAIHRNGETYVKYDNQLTQLVPPTEADMSRLRELYARENLTEEVVHYGPTFFSMNRGDYQKPILYEEFRWYEMPFQENLFDALLSGITFDDVTKGRKGTVLVQSHPTRGIPIVRTTTKYLTPAQEFHFIHSQLAQYIQDISLLPLPLNNALIEVYNNSYCTMGFHSDQALDLEEDSSIAIYTCYKYPHLLSTIRKLIIQRKDSLENYEYEIPLIHNSIIVFHQNTNRQYLHKIILENSSSSSSSTLPENEWLGITFRTSKTFIQYHSSNHIYFENGTELLLANDYECKEFYSLRRRENQEIDYIYPSTISYTISPSDLMPPIPPPSPPPPPPPPSSSSYEEVKTITPDNPL